MYPKTQQYIHFDVFPVCETVQHQLMNMFSVSLGLRLLSLAQDSTKPGADAQPGSGLDSESALGQYVPVHIGHPNYPTVILGGLPSIIVTRARETSGFTST